MTGKKAILDASSAILLYKVGLHYQLAEMYDVVLSESVYREITANRYAGAAEYTALSTGQKIRIMANPQIPDGLGKTGLDAGETDTIHLFISGKGDFIITDDGPAARFCSRQGIPFINALLFPVVMQFSDKVDELGCRKLMEKIIAVGRYLEKVIAYARNCPREAIDFALPPSN